MRLKFKHECHASPEELRDSRQTKEEYFDEFFTRECHPEYADHLFKEYEKFNKDYGRHEKVIYVYMWTCPTGYQWTEYPNPNEEDDPPVTGRAVTRKIPKCTHPNLDKNNYCKDCEMFHTVIEGGIIPSDN